MNYKKSLIIFIGILLIIGIIILGFIFFEKNHNLKFEQSVNLSNFKKIATFNDANSEYSDIYGISSDGNYLYIAYTYDGLKIYKFNGSTTSVVDNFSPKLLDSKYPQDKMSQRTMKAFPYNGYVYVADDELGLYVGKIVDSRFEKIARASSADSIVSPQDVYVYKNYIYVADYQNGLLMFSFDGKNLNKLDHIPIQRGAVLAVASDGNYVYSANSNGLFAYEFVNGKLKELSHIEEENYAYLGEMQSAHPNGVFSDGKYIYLANGHDGLRIYTFDGVSFKNVGHIIEEADNGYANGVFSDGKYIYLANGSDGLRIYTFDGVNFKSEHIPNLNIKTNTKTVYSDGKYVYVANNANLDIYEIVGNKALEDYKIISQGDEARLKQDKFKNFFDATEIVSNNLPNSIEFWVEATCPSQGGKYQYLAPKDFLIASCEAGQVGSHGGCSTCEMSKITLNTCNDTDCFLKRDKYLEVFFNATEIVEDSLPSFVRFWTTGVCPVSTAKNIFAIPKGLVIEDCVDGPIGSHGGCSTCEMREIELSISMDGNRGIPLNYSEAGGTESVNNFKISFDNSIDGDCNSDVCDGSVLEDFDEVQEEISRKLTKKILAEAFSSDVEFKKILSKDLNFTNVIINRGQFDLKDNQQMVVATFKSNYQYVYLIYSDLTNKLSQYGYRYFGGIDFDNNPLKLVNGYSEFFKGSITQAGSGTCTGYSDTKLLCHIENKKIKCQEFRSTGDSAGCSDYVTAADTSFSDINNDGNKEVIEVFNVYRSGYSSEDQRGYPVVKIPFLKNIYSWDNEKQAFILVDSISLPTNQ